LNILSFFREQSKDLPLGTAPRRSGPKETGVVIRTVYDAQKKEPAVADAEQKKESVSEAN